MARIEGAIVIHRPVHEVFDFVFDPVPAGTRMRWSWRIRPRSLLKLMTPVVARIGQRQEETIWTGLKHVLEGQQAPLPAGR